MNFIKDKKYTFCHFIVNGIVNQFKTCSDIKHDTGKRENLSQVRPDS